MYVCMYVNLFKHLLRNHLPIETNFHMEPPWDGGTKVYSNGPHHNDMTKMAAMSIYSKNLKILLLRNQRVYDLEIWYVSSDARVLTRLLKLCPQVDVDLFYDKVKFGPLCFCMGKR